MNAIDRPGQQPEQPVHGVPDQSERFRAVAGVQRAGQREYRDQHDGRSDARAVARAGNVDAGDRVRTAGVGYGDNRAVHGSAPTTTGALLSRAACRTPVRPSWPAGKAQTYNVGITNNGSTTEEYFVDARLAGSAPLSLTSLVRPGYDGAARLRVREHPCLPRPDHTTAFTEVASTTGSNPIQFDSSSPWGDPEVALVGGQPGQRIAVREPAGPGVCGRRPDCGRAVRCHGRAQRAGARQR